MEESPLEKKYFCKICGKESKLNIIHIKEHMIGTHEEFEYAECEHCKSLELINIPENMGQYYGEDYYSFKNFNQLSDFIMKHLKNSYFKNDILGKFLRFFIKDNHELYTLVSKMFKEKKIAYDSEILDIGCGSGTFLYELSNIGFEHLDGMEPFIEEEIKDDRFTIYKSFLDDFNPNKKYGLIFMKDSLEHMDDPFLSLKKATKLLEKEGYLIITIPIKTKYFYNLYGEDWFQLDAPRHLITFSLNGFESMIKRLNLNLENIIFDSNPYAFIISEDYIKGNSMYSENSFATKSLFKNELRKRFKKVYIEKLDKKTTYHGLNPIINELNKNQNSEHALFLLRK